MDEPGFHARRRAEKEAREARRLGKLGAPYPDTVPIDDQAQPHAPVNAPQQAAYSAYETPGYRPPPTVPTEQIPGATQGGEHLQGAVSAPGPSGLAPLPQGQRLYSPHLQIMCGPLLRYDTVVNNVYHAFAMLVTADTGSVYQPAPFMQIQWDATGGAVEAQLASLSISQPPPDHESTHTQTIQGQQIYHFASLAGGNTFWRFKIEVPLGERQEQIFYSINNGPENSFWVPAFNQNMRWVGHSCNGFSAGVDTKAFNGPDPLWRDVLRMHEEKPVHVIIGGGDQIYCDPVAREPELSEWIGSSDSKWKETAPMTDDMRLALDRFLFNHYASWFRSGAFAQAARSIPMLNICDDHDLIDGFGSYPDALQSSPVFSTIGSRGYFWFLLFQMFIVDEVDGTNPAGPHPSKNIVWGGEGAWIPFPNRSYLSYLGPSVYILLLDCRAERKKDQICSSKTYQNVFNALRALPSTVTHVVMLLGVPIAYPRMGLGETILESKYNPMSLLGKAGVLPGSVNKFNSEAELLDDLNDHWCAGHHKKERNWLVKECQKLALERHYRISFLSGDVHCASVSEFHSTKKVEHAKDPKYMLQIISSAIVNTPPPPALIYMVSTLGKKRHKTLHDVDTDETMVPLFDHDTDGSKLKNKTVMGRRNYVLVDMNDQDGSLLWDMRIETTQGAGTTKSYPISAPAPRW